MSGIKFIAGINGNQRFVFAKRAYHGVFDAEVMDALDNAGTVQARKILIVTNSILSRNMDEQVKAQGVTVWDREKLIHYMGKARARKFALQAIERHPNNS